MFCSGCGNQLYKDEKFCPKCGQKIISNIHNEDGKKELNFSDELENEQGLSRKKLYIFCGIALVIALIIAFIVMSFYIDKKEKQAKKTQEVSSEIKEKTVKNVTENKTQETPVETPDSNEYIFPNSDKAYLTDKEVETLSVDELALARNEIIARHGRIFKDERFKSYFESKSWYKGTVEPETFDANFENHLNNVEKANVQLIKKYEGNSGAGNVKELAQEYYDSFLEFYRQQESEGFVQKDMQFINRSFTNYGCNFELYYTVIDLANDGLPELFIGDSEGRLYGAYGMEEIQRSMRYLVSTGGADMGDRAHVYICENNMLKVEASGGADNNYISYHQAEKGMGNSTCVEGIEQDGNNYYFGYWDDMSFIETGVATAQDYEQMENKYSLKQGIEWYKLSEYGE